MFSLSNYDKNRSSEVNNTIVLILTTSHLISNLYQEEIHNSKYLNSYYYFSICTSFKFLCPTFRPNTWAFVRKI